MHEAQISEHDPDDVVVEALIERCDLTEDEASQARRPLARVGAQRVVGTQCQSVRGSGLSCREPGDARPTARNPLAARPADSSFAKNSSAVFVFVCCSPVRSTPFFARKPRLGRDLHRLGRGALRRELEDARAVRVEPELGDERTPEPRGHHFSLRTKIGPEHREIVELDALGRVSSKNARCSFEKSFLSGLPPSDRVSTSVVPSFALQRRRAHEPSGHRVDLDPEFGRLPQLLRECVGHDRAQLHDGVVALALDRRARTTTPAWLSASSGVSKKKTWRICASSGSISSAATAERGSTPGTVSFSSTLSAPLTSAEHLSELLVRQPAGVCVTLAIARLPLLASMSPGFAVSSPGALLANVGAGSGPRGEPDVHVVLVVRVRHYHAAGTGTTASRSRRRRSPHRRRGSGRAGPGRGALSIWPVCAGALQHRSSRG